MELFSSGEVCGTDVFAVAGAGRPPQSGSGMTRSLKTSGYKS
ncbi:hypothetical protein ACFV06_13590 [Streptomyces sp. NPDC059618]